MSTETTKRARIHRFRESVAVYFEGAENTQYLTAQFARDTAQLLIECADNIDAQSFVDSNFPTTEIYAEPETTDV